MQAVFKNPLASPYILGLSSGASLGAAISIVLAIPFIPMALCTPILAFITCFLTMILVYTMARTGGIVKTETLILSGVAVSALLSALVSFLTFIAGEKLEGIVFWSMGNLGNADWGEIAFAAPVITVASILLITQAKNLNVLVLDCLLLGCAILCCFYYCCFIRYLVPSSCSGRPNGDHLHLNPQPFLPHRLLQHCARQVSPSCPCCTCREHERA